MGIFKQVKPRLNRRKITRSRRVFGFKTHEAQIRLVKFRGKNRVFRPAQQGKKIFAERNLLRLQIFHGLFPENSLTPVSIGFMEEKGEHVWGVLTNILRKRSGDYKKYQKLFYSHKYWLKQPEFALNHREFVRKNADPLRESIEREAGIALDMADVNACNVEGRPVFFEIWKINQHKCMQYIEHTVANKAKKKRLLDSLQKLEYIERKQLHGH